MAEHCTATSIRSQSSDEDGVGMEVGKAWLARHEENDWLTNVMAHFSRNGCSSEIAASHDSLAGKPADGNHKQLHVTAVPLSHFSGRTVKHTQSNE